MLARTARLPGIRFDVQAPAPQFVLPRMDIGMFVGFASTGPLHRPVAVEDAAHFREIFGEDLPLAWDGRRGAFEMAYLGPAVRSFFRNGGRRCYVVRVAGPAAQSNRFPVPGLLHADRDRKLGPAWLQARSPGSWSDTLQAGMETLLQPLQLVEFRSNAKEAVLLSGRAGDLLPGDLLRFTCRLGEMRYQLMLVPDWIETLNSSPRSSRLRMQWKEERWSSIVVARDPDEKDTMPAAGQAVRIHWQKTRWFRIPGPPDAPLSSRARLHGSPTEPPWITAWQPESIRWETGKPVQLALDLEPGQSPEPGRLVEVEFGTERLWLVVLSAHAMLSDMPGDSKKKHVVITASGVWESDPPAQEPVEYSVERLRLRLVAKQAGTPAANHMSISDLGFTSSQAHSWNALPTDAKLYALQTAEADKPYAALWNAAARPRFPFAGFGVDPHSPQEEPDYPVPLPADASLFSGPIPSMLTPFERSGLDSFSVDVFLDPFLKDAGVETLQPQADFLSYQSSVAHDPEGIYTALRLEEVTLIAAPDVLHIGWERDLSRPEFLKTKEPPLADMKCTPPLAEDLPGNFSDRFYLGQPVLTIDPPGDPTSAGAAFRVRWSAADGPVETYRLEESLSADFSNATTIYHGDRTMYDLSGRSTGAYYYRVRAEGSPPLPVLVGPWSAGTGIRLGAVRPWQTQAPEKYREEALIRFHTCLLTLCAARGDLFAVLSLPACYHEEEALQYAGRLQGMLNARTLGFGALYHPWLYIEQERREDLSFLTPPEGAVCGAIARRTLARGAWLAPANDPLSSVLALEPVPAAGRLLELQEGGLNIIRQEARGLMILSEQTLSNEDEIRPIHVRRLLMLLRRLVQREGSTFVFELNSQAFRRQVQRGLEQVLSDLYQRGAFGGDTPESAYQVDVSDRINTPTSIEQGRLIVEIKVAPSHPLAFLTIRLVMSGASGLQIQESA